MVIVVIICIILLALCFDMSIYYIVREGKDFKPLVLIGILAILYINIGTFGLIYEILYVWE